MSSKEHYDQHRPLHLAQRREFCRKDQGACRTVGADAIRNSDGTHLDEAVLALGKKIYNAYFPTRAHNEWITLHMDETRRCTC